jgi:hypothetical protein
MLVCRKFWKWSFVLSFAGAVSAVAWVTFFQKDPDFQWIGPETVEIRALYDSLEMPVDLLDFQEPRNLGDTLRTVRKQLEDQGCCPIFTDPHTFLNDHDIENIDQIDIRFPPGIRRMSLRLFLKTIIEQVPTKNGVFILWQQGFLELTTVEQLQRDKEWYYEEHRITPLDRLRHRLSETFGGKGSLPRPPLRIRGKDKRLDGPA